jgi:segregation and condensation protein B
MSELETNHIAALEALLFIHGEPLTVARAAAHLAISEEEVNVAASSLAKKYELEDSGLRLLTYGERLQAVTKSQYAHLLEKFVKDELSEELSPATLETLSIISYLGPVSRSRIEYLRGVNSVFTLRNLMLRGLIERTTEKEKAGAVLYRLAPECLRHLGVATLEELPQYSETRSMLEKIEKGQDEDEVEVIPGGTTENTL